MDAISGILSLSIFSWMFDPPHFEDSRQLPIFQNKTEKILTWISFKRSNMRHIELRKIKICFVPTTNYQWDCAYFSLICNIFFNMQYFLSFEGMAHYTSLQCIKYIGRQGTKWRLVYCFQNSEINHSMKMCFLFLP